VKDLQAMLRESAVRTHDNEYIFVISNDSENFSLEHSEKIYT